MDLKLRKVCDLALTRSYRPPGGGVAHCDRLVHSSEHLPAPNAASRASVADRNKVVRNVLAPQNDREAGRG
ncbi:hypothetical protein GCM10029976_095430 [Kribbella albertanoniae]